MASAEIIISSGTMPMDLLSITALASTARITIELTGTMCKKAYYRPKVKNYKAHMQTRQRPGMNCQGAADRLVSLPI